MWKMNQRFQSFWPNWHFLFITICVHLQGWNINWLGAITVVFYAIYFRLHEKITIHLKHCKQCQSVAKFCCEFHACLVWKFHKLTSILVGKIKWIIIHQFPDFLPQCVHHFTSNKQVCLIQVLNDKLLSKCQSFIQM